MRRVLFQIVLSVFLILEFSHKNMRDALLRSLLATPLPFSGSTRTKQKRQQNTYLFSFWTILATSDHRSQIRSIRDRAETSRFQGQHSLADLAAGSIPGAPKPLDPYIPESEKEKIGLTSWICSALASGLNSNITTWMIPILSRLIGTAGPREAAVGRM